MREDWLIFILDIIFETNSFNGLPGPWQDFFLQNSSVLFTTLHRGSSDLAAERVGENRESRFPPVTRVLKALAEALEVPPDTDEGVAGGKKEGRGGKAEDGDGSFHEGDVSCYRIFSKSVVTRLSNFDRRCGDPWPGLPAPSQLTGPLLSLGLRQAEAHIIPPKGPGEVFGPLGGKAGGVGNVRVRNEVVEDEFVSL